LLQIVVIFSAVDHTLFAQAVLLLRFSDAEDRCPSVFEHCGSSALFFCSDFLQ
jgi:hypothetical protein